MNPVPTMAVLIFDIVNDELILSFRRPAFAAANQTLYRRAGSWSLCKLLPPGSIPQILPGRPVNRPIQLVKATYVW
jgi:hypothetical protein